MKLQAHEDKLPMDMATDRGATSNSSERNKEKNKTSKKCTFFISVSIKFNDLIKILCVVDMCVVCTTHQNE